MESPLCTMGEQLCGLQECDCGVRWISGEVIVQTCTTEVSVGEVVRESLDRRSRYYP